MDLGSKGTLKSLFVPGGILLLAAAVLLSGGLLSISAAAVDFYYYAVFLAGILLAHGRALSDVKADTRA